MQVRHVSGWNYTVVGPRATERCEAAPEPDRVYVRIERHGRIRARVWGMEHAGVRSEVVEAAVAARRSIGGGATVALCIERDLRRALGL
jgi:hypothetical protein